MPRRLGKTEAPPVPPWDDSLEAEEPELHAYVTSRLRLVTGDVPAEPGWFRELFDAVRALVFAEAEYELES